MNPMHHLLLIPFLTYAMDEPSQQDSCAQVPVAFREHIRQVTSDTTGRFFHDYPTPLPLTCELLDLLYAEQRDDSVRYHIEHVHQRYGDTRAGAAFSYIARHNHFHLAMVLATHWNPDTRIEAIRAVFEYRRIRPMVCATKEHYAQLERQDRAAVRYFIRVLEKTPRSLVGGENVVIHGVYMGDVVRVLDLFTGQTHNATGDMRMTFDMPEGRMQQALEDWRHWLEQ